MTRLTSALPTRESGRHRTPTRTLGGRSTVGHVALDHVIGVRIPASQPVNRFSQFNLRLRFPSSPTYLHGQTAASVGPTT